MKANDIYKSGRCVGRHQVPMAATVMLMMMSNGCGSRTSSSTPQANTPKAPQTYLAPLVAGATDGVSALAGPQIYTLDDVGKAFSQTSYRVNPPQQQGAQILNAGLFTIAARGLLSLESTAHYAFDTSSNRWLSTVYNPHQTGSFAVELAGQAGALVQLLGQPATPLVPTASCPNIPKPTSYNFLTIPLSLYDATSNFAPTDPALAWNPKTQAAFGSVDISASGSSVLFDKIRQLTFPGGAPSDPAPVSVNAVCGSSAFGQTISIPGQVIVQNPGAGSVISTIPTQAIAGIGPSGLFVEDNGFIAAGSGAGSFQNTLGAGTGAVGLPTPSSALDSHVMVGGQYLGFVYGSGVYTSGNPSSGMSSHLTSFGFSSPPPNCPFIPASTGTVIYGGDFNNDDPATSLDGFSNCDLALDLGTQDAATNGLYTNATVRMTANYAHNAGGEDHQFSAVAIAGQLQGKAVIFVLGVDSTQAWSMYLFQSN